MMKRISFAVIALACCSTLASAADLPIVLPGLPSLPTSLPAFKAPSSQPAIAWTGFYIGAHGGYASDLRGVDINANAPLAGIAGEVAQAPRGALGGVQIGYDFAAISNIVFGVRADAALANISANNALTTISLGSLNVVTVQNATNYLGTADGRIGYQVAPNVMPYVIGGFAWGGNKPNFQVASFGQALNDTSIGWNLGAGVEVRLAQNWSAFLEYDYVRLGDSTLTLTGPGNVVLATSTNHLDFGAGKFGVNYRF